MGCPAASSTYVPRRTHECDAARVVREHLPRFLARLEGEGGAALPSFVVDELRAFGRCGDLELGFLLAACTRCGEQVRVPFSCKGRGACGPAPNPWTGCSRSA